MSDNEIDDGLDPAQVTGFIKDWSPSGGNERANTHGFIRDLCDLLGLPRPDPAQEINARNDYVFERSVTRNHSDGHTSTRFLDLYKRGAFVLEAKQSAAGGKKRADPAQIELHGIEAGDTKTGTAKRGTNAWVTAMRKAREQAEAYAKDLPPDHGWPPFLIVCDVGYCFEIYADFSGQGKNYAHFPDRRGFRILLDDLKNPVIRQRLRDIWTDPHGLDPAKKSAEVTRDIASRLAVVAKDLEKRHDAETVALFLMRCLFTMFAEDVELLKKGSFTAMLEELQGMPDKAHLALEQLWSDMNTGAALNAWIREPVRRFNGGLFREARALPLTAEMVAELTIAARRDWRDVEPAIFGTLLEQALDKKERHQLGAHYTPRSYVERLVTPTIIEPLREDWRDVLVEAQMLIDAGKTGEARNLARRFHEQLCAIRVLDPACGTGNFLYVAMEMMKKLEGDVVDFITELGGEATLEFQGHTVDPHQFLGIELNPRAAAIAELVLWIGYIKWQLKTGGQDVVVDPVLRDFHNVECRDAVLSYSDRTLRLDEHGKPVTRWDGETMKPHPVTGELVPDEGARIELYDYAGPKAALWPQADFIVGNPPFIGGKDLRADLGDGYAEALWAAHKDMPKSADFVMYWWNQAARHVAAGAKKGGGGKPRRFGFITTNSIRQTFNRRVIEKALSGKPPLSIIFAIPDHPWMKSADKAAVRIAMTVVVPGEELEGSFAEVVSESGLNTDQPEVRLETKAGIIDPAIQVGARVTSTVALTANKALAHMGVKLHGGGFLLDSASAARFGNSPLIKQYVNGRDLAQHRRGLWTIDAFSLTEAELAANEPKIYQYLLDSVKPERMQNNREVYKKYWWIWGEPRKEWRVAANGLTRAICTVRTARHRIFQFLDMNTVAESKVVTIASDASWLLACLSSHAHVAFATASGGWLGIGNDPTYNHSNCFDPFPFPDLTDKPALKARLDELGERLDAHRKAVLAKHDFLTMTKLYNVFERVRALEGVASTRSVPDPVRDTSPIKGEEGVRHHRSAPDPAPSSSLMEEVPPQGAELVEMTGGPPPLSEAERDIYEAGLVGVLRSIHDEIDGCVFEAYGWPSDLSEEQILERLVALNLERHEEEKAGHVRWLRPDFQIPRFAPKTASKQGEMALADEAVAATGKLPAFPAKDRAAQARLLRETLMRAGKPLNARAVAALFAKRNTPAKIARVGEMLSVLEALGQAEADGEGRYFTRA
ncbi:class I SAM-dependent DNA methyltransferase [Maricaulis sp.]|uniref:class I SAM-dependent DNA methyltransferase n=1 Tax=Maricaulis sp. TaxID=1486257 RepID=UPI003A950D5E